MTRSLFNIRGIVQGVGFRPFVYKIAKKFELTGFVFNHPEGVTIELQGDDENIIKFEKILQEELPPLAKIDTLQKTTIPLKNDSDFKIIESRSDSISQKTTLISPDIGVCQDCLDDIKKTKKYFNYFATNCTNCGPRYSIINTIPYDRKNTSMESFLMCDSCLEEYANPENRRYHAQPISCNNCGPKLKIFSKNEQLNLTDDAILREAARLIKNGKIGAIKGIGGFNIVCDSTNNESINRLRLFKNRATKPFALMFKNLEQIKKVVLVNDKEKELLLSKEAPIVILKTIKTNNMDTKISHLVAPNINRIGCLLPYTPLHYLLFENLDFPIIATSANLGNEPIITKIENVIASLPFVEFIVDYDRDIINGIDDSLVQTIDNQIQTLRLGRGYGPKAINLPLKIDQKILAVGGSSKNSIAIAFDDKIIVSPYIGDTDNLKTFEYFTRTIETFKRFYDFEPDVIICDKHPNYATTKWAKQQNKKIIQLQHHLAHIYSVKAEFSLSTKQKYLGFSFDGTGYGDDGTIWGGEIFIGDTRKYHFKQTKLLGGAKAIKEPRRIALSLLFDKYNLDEILTFDLSCVKSFTKNEIKILHQSYIKNINSPLCSSVGRLFDGVTSLGGLLHIQSFEGEAGLLCETLFTEDMNNCFSYSLEDNIIDIKFDFFDKNIVIKFMNTLINIIIDIAGKEQLDVILTGGVFQNKCLLEATVKRLKEKNIAYYFNQTTLTNDGGIALGQIMYALDNIDLSIASL